MNSFTSQVLRVVKVLGQFLFLYGLFGWAYGVLVQVTHPDWLPGMMSHLTPWLRLDTFTILSFIASGFGFLLWRLANELMESNRSRTQPQP